MLGLTGSKTLPSSWVHVIAIYKCHGLVSKTMFYLSSSSSQSPDRICDGSNCLLGVKTEQFLLVAASFAPKSLSSYRARDRGLAYNYKTIGNAIKMAKKHIYSQIGFKCMHFFLIIILFCQSHHLFGLLQIRNIRIDYGFCSSSKLEHRDYCRHCDKTRTIESKSPLVAFALLFQQKHTKEVT